MLSSIQEIREIRETPAGRQHRRSGGLGVMASDGIESKMVGVGLGPEVEVDLTDEEHEDDPHGRGYEDGYYDRYQYRVYSNGEYSVLGAVLSQVLNLIALR